MKMHKAKKILKACLPDLGDMSMLLRGLALVGIVATLGYLFYYSSNQVKAQSMSGGQIVDSAAGIGFLRGVESFANGSASTDGGVKGSEGGIQGSSLAANTLQAPYNTATAVSGSAAASNGSPSAFRQIDYGATGRLINSTSDLYQKEVASPSYMPQYYAHRAAGTAMAADPTSGSSVLQPMFFLSNAMRNLAYGLIVILLVLSSFSILVGYLAGGEQKITLVQVMLNTFMTLLLITFYYQIAAMIYDLSVNYGNMLVASIMEPFINAKVILERLGPGGDLNLTAMTNVFEFAGLGGAINTIAGNIMLGARPAITQSLYGVNDAIGGGFGQVGSAFAWMNSFSTGTVGLGINAVLSGVLGSQALFDAVIAWVIFFVNLKIFGNLIYSFISFNMYVGFGPLLMLQAVNQGFGKATSIFKTLFAYGMTFPVTFLFILLGATAMNFYYKTPANLGGGDAGSTADRQATALCAFQTNDAAKGEANLTYRVGVKDANDSPLSFRRENSEYQDIFDTVSAPSSDPNLRNCRSSLFALPFTFFPAPLGNYGNRMVQVQTTDVIVRTAMAIMFLVIASRAPDILKELLQVEEMKSLQGLGGAFKAGLQPVLAIGGVGMGIATGLTFKAMGRAGGMAGKALSNVSFSNNGAIGKQLTTARQAYGDRLRAGTRKSGDRTSLGDFWGGLSIDDNFEKGTRKAESLRNAAKEWNLNKENKTAQNYWYNPDNASEVAYIEDAKDARLSGKNADGTARTRWRRMQGGYDADTGKKYDGNHEAAYSLGKQYADPVIGGQMQGWLTAMGGASTATASLTTAFTELEKMIVSVTGHLQKLSGEMLAENF
jgi:hypothetical protein